jgi:PqqD family protein of HPr-rel-A system
VSGPLYRATTADERLSVAAEGLLLLFHRPSGATHILASPAAEILDALDHGPGDCHAILERLARDHDLGASDEAEAVVSARLDELAAVGLVERQ